VLEGAEFGCYVDFNVNGGDAGEGMGMRGNEGVSE